jgi:hypothetical protein
MLPLLSKSSKTPAAGSQVMLITDPKEIKPGFLTEQEHNYVLQRRALKKEFTVLNRYSEWIFIQFNPPLAEGQSRGVYLEKCRKAGDSLLSLFHEHDITDVTISAPAAMSGEILAFSEGRERL